MRKTLELVHHMNEEPEEKKVEVRDESNIISSEDVEVYDQVGYGAYAKVY